MLGGLAAFLDGFERIDGERVAQAMGHRWIEDDIAELLSWLSDSDLSDGIVEEEPDLLIGYRVLVFAGQKVWIVIVGIERCPKGEVVFHLLNHGLGKRDQSVFSELGFLNVDRPLLSSIVVLHQLQGFGDSHAASGHEQDRHVHG